jgi:protein SCO1/2
MTGANCLSRRAALAVALSWAGTVAWAHKNNEDARLPVVGPAPDFALTAATGERVALADLRGKVLAVTFIFASCSDTCPLLTAKMAEVQRRLGADFGSRVGFVSITVDPANDTPERLREYAARFGADVPGWSFATGSPAQIDEVVRRYGGFAKRTPKGDLEHLTLTSLIDARGRLRVQYLGWRFDARELLADLRSLLREA